MVAEYVLIGVGVLADLVGLAGAACMIMAYLWDHEAATATGCMEEGQVW